MKKKVVKKKKKTYKTFRSYDLTPMQQFSLCDAMRYSLAALLMLSLWANFRDTGISELSRLDGRLPMSNTRFMSSSRLGEADLSFETALGFRIQSRLTHESVSSARTTAL